MHEISVLRKPESSSQKDSSIPFFDLDVDAFPTMLLSSKGRHLKSFR